MAVTSHGELMKLFCKTLKVFNQTSREPMLLPHTILINGGKPVLWIYPFDHEHAKQVEDSLLKIKTVLCRFVVLEPNRPTVNKLSDMAAFENIYDTIDQEKERDKEVFKIEREREALRKMKEDRALMRKKKRQSSKEKLDGSSSSNVGVEMRSNPQTKMIKFEIEKPKIDYSKRFLVRFVFQGAPPDEADPSKKSFRIKVKSGSKTSEAPRSTSYCVDSYLHSFTTKLISKLLRDSCTLNGLTKSMPSFAKYLLIGSISTK
jgi:hypothetical protein